MSCLSRAVETGQELVCVTALAAVLGADTGENEPDVDRVIAAVRDFGMSSYGDVRGPWVVRTMYSDRVLAWLTTKVLEGAREQGVFEGQEEGGTPGG